MDEETQEVLARAQIPILFRRVRQTLGLTQLGMSAKTGISRVQISYYETGDSVPTMLTFRKWVQGVEGEIRRLRRIVEGG